MYIIDLWITIVSLTSLWALWTFGFRQLILDRFRFEIEGLLDDLDSVVATGCLSITSEAYRSQRAILEGIVSVAPHFGILQLVITYRHNQETTNGTSDNPSILFEQSIAHLQEFAQGRLRAIRYKMALVTLRFVLFRAPVVMGLAYTFTFLQYITGRRKKSTDPIDSLLQKAEYDSIHRQNDHVLA